MIYLISFLEALAGGLVGVNTALYFKFTLGLTEVQSASVFSGMGILGSVLILLLGPMVDKIGSKKAMLIGATTLIIGRLALGCTHSLRVALAFIVLMSIGSAIKGSSVLITLRNQNRSFKLDYVIFNLAYCISGFLFDYLHNYSLTFILAGIITIINLFAVFFLPTDAPIVKSEQKVSLYDYKTLKIVTLYNGIMLPVSGIFTFMAAFIPKWALVAIGPGAPVGKLYGSLNPAIILGVVPLFAYIANRYKFNPYKSAIVGTTISALSLLLVGLPVSWLLCSVGVIVTFTVGEAIWSPANMEVGTLLCPKGQEGKYLTISLIPRTLIGFVMSYAIAYEFTHNVYGNQHFALPFAHMALFALLTPIGLILFKNKLSNTI